MHNVQQQKAEWSNIDHKSLVMRWGEHENSNILIHESFLSDSQPLLLFFQLSF